MIVLDTDCLSLLVYPNTARAQKLIARMEGLPATATIGVTIISVEERLRGWLAVIAKEKMVLRQTTAYRELSNLIDFYLQYEILPFDDAAAQKFVEFRKSKIRVGTLDLKIASIALVQGALLVSSNLGDFRQVPGLRVENWAD